MQMTVARARAKREVEAGDQGEVLTFTQRLSNNVTRCDTVLMMVMVIMMVMAGSWRSS